jgi:hypothetical protein
MRIRNAACLPSSSISLVKALSLPLTLFLPLPRWPNCKPALILVYQMPSQSSPAQRSAVAAYPKASHKRPAASLLKLLNSLRPRLRLGCPAPRAPTTCTASARLVLPRVKVITENISIRNKTLLSTLSNAPASSGHSHYLGEH